MASHSYPHGDPASFQTLIDIVRQLRQPGGCPWDREQTHESLKRNLLEECYEVMEVIDSKEPGKLAEELGDVLVQIAFHSDIAAEAGEFEISDVLTKINDKLVRRHPHVFADAKVRDAQDVERQWERLKQAEGSRRSRVEGVPRDMPALATAQLLTDRVGRDGFEWEDMSGVLDKLVEEAGELKAASSPEERQHEFGDLLLSMVNLARWLGVHAEDALRQANGRFKVRYSHMEDVARGKGMSLAQLSLEEKEELWQNAKLES